MSGPEWALTYEKIKVCIGKNKSQISIPLNIILHIKLLPSSTFEKHYWETPKLDFSSNLG